MPGSCFNLLRKNGSLASYLSSHTYSIDTEINRLFKPKLKLHILVEEKDNDDYLKKLSLNKSCDKGCQNETIIMNLGTPPFFNGHSDTLHFLYFTGKGISSF